MKFRDIVASAVANSFRSKLRTSLTVIAIFIGAFTLSITSAIGTGISDYIDTQVSSLGAADTMTVMRAADDATDAGDSGPAPYDPNAPASAAGGMGGFGGDPLTDADIDEIAGIDGILSVRPVVTVVPSFIQHDLGEKFQFSANPGSEVGNPDLAAGDPLDNASASNQLLLPTTYLDALDLGEPADAVGQEVTIGISDYVGQMHEVDATVVGILNDSLFGSAPALSGSLTDELVEVQDIGRPDSLQRGYFAAVATFDDTVAADQVVALQDRLAAAGFTGQTVADQIGMVQTVIDGIIGVLNAFAVIALIAAGFGIVNTLLMSVQERTREIGLMKAMGLGNGKVFALFSSEAVFIGFLGSALGAGVAIGVGTLISNILAGGILADLPGLQVLQFAPTSVATIILIVMGIAFLAGTLPARRASRQHPIDALRYE